MLKWSYADILGKTLIAFFPSVLTLIQFWHTSSSSTQFTGFTASHQFVSQEIQKSFDEKNVQMLQEAMNKLHPEVSVVVI